LFILQIILGKVTNNLIVCIRVVVVRYEITRTESVLKAATPETDEILYCLHIAQTESA
jgi:hypothetical protein